MGELSEAAWERLHECCLRGMLAAPDDDVTEALVTAGLVRTTARGGIAPTGDAKTASRLRARLTPGGDQERAVSRFYEAFATLNRELKHVVTAWQERAAARRAAPGSLHPEDWKLVDRLRDIDERVGPGLRRVGEAVPRLATYRPRLRAALVRLEAGDPDWFSGVLCDSYHTVWWHLHEDLMWALGLDAAAEPNR